MTDKEKIKEEIESYKESMKGLEPHSDFRRGQITAYNQIMQFIDSLPEEPASEDLEEYAKNLTKGAALDKHNLIWMCKKGAEWQKQQMKEALQTEYEKGRFDMREETMKNAVETTIVNDWQYGKDPDHAIIPAVHQRIDGFDVGDKVTIIIIKEVRNDF